MRFSVRKKKEQSLPCAVACGDLIYNVQYKTSKDQMQDKVQDKQNDEKRNDAKVQDKQNDEKRNDALPPAEGNDDARTALLSPLLAVGGFLSSLLVSPVPSLEEVYPEELYVGGILSSKNAPNTPPPQVPDAGQIVRQRTEELSNVVTETWGQALTALSSFGSHTKEEFAENTSKQVQESARNADSSIGGTSTGVVGRLNGSVSQDDDGDISRYSDRKHSHRDKRHDDREDRNRRGGRHYARKQSHRRKDKCYDNDDWHSDHKHSQRDRRDDDGSSRCSSSSNSSSSPGTSNSTSASSAGSSTSSGGSKSYMYCSISASSSESSSGDDSDSTSVSSQDGKSLFAERASTTCSDKDDGSSVPSVASRKAIASLSGLSPTLRSQFYTDKMISIILREEFGVDFKQKLARMEKLERARQLEELMGAETTVLAKRANKMKSQMEQYDMDALREDSAARREDLANRRGHLEQRQNRLNGKMSKLYSRDETVSSGKPSLMNGSVSTYSDEDDGGPVASLLTGLSVVKKDAVPPVKSLDKKGKPVYNTIMSKLISSPILKPTSITLTDNFNSSQHANHVGSKGWAESGDSHFSLEVVSEAFEGLTLVKRHRMIYALLGEIMQKIHSLDIEAKSTSEVPTSLFIPS